VNRMLISRNGAHALDVYRRLRTIVAILAAVFAASCGSAVPEGRIVQVTLERTTCYGTCPAYRVTISGDGLVTYEGKQYVEVSGIRTKRIDAEALSALADEVARVDYFVLQNTYDSAEDGCRRLWTDNPAANTSVRIARTTKTIHHYLGCREDGREGSFSKSYPQALTSFEDAIDRIAGTKEWIGTGSERSRDR